MAYSNLNETILFNDIAGSINFDVTATNSASGGEPGNAVTNVVKNKAMSAGTGTWYLKLKGTAAHAIKAIAVLGINTDAWETLKAQASNNNFNTISAEMDLTVASRPLEIYDESRGEIIDSTRHDAYAFVDWSYRDYRIAMNSSAVSSYEIGRAYLARDTYVIDKESEFDQPAGLVTTSITIDGLDGQFIQIPTFQRMDYTLDFRGIDKRQADILTKRVAVNPTVCYFIDGPVSGELYFGSLRFEPRRARGVVFSPDKIFLQGRFTESL